MVAQDHTPVPLPTNPRFIDLTGRRFGRLAVMAFSRTDDGHSMWECLCDCGRPAVVLGASLRSGKTTSCGCYLKERISETHRKHGAAMQGATAMERKALRAYHAAKNRCTNPSYHDFQSYGGRGTRFLFESFEEFIADIGPCPSKVHSIDRKNGAGHYGKGNVRWATPSEQSANRCNTLTVKYKDGQLTLVEACSRFGLPYSTTRARLLRGMTLDEIIAAPRNLKAMTVLLNGEAISLSEACRRVGQSYAIAKYRINKLGWDVHRSLYDPRRRKPSSPSS